MLQTFSKDKKVDFSKVPFCLEAKNERCYKLLENLAKLIGNKIYNINSEAESCFAYCRCFCE